MVLQVFPLAWYMSMLAWRSLVHQPDCDAFSEPIQLQTDPITDHSAVRRVLKDILLCNVEIDNCRFPTGYGYASGLMVAAKEGYTDLVSELADKANNIGAACSWRSKALMLWRSNALMLAAENGHHEIFKLIRESLGKTNQNPIGPRGLTPLHVAAKNGHLNICKIILEEVDDKNPVKDDGLTPLVMAANNGHFEIFHFISEIVLVKNPKTNDVHRQLIHGNTS